MSAVATASAQTCVADALVGGSIAVTGDLTHVAFTIGSDVITKTGTYSYAPGDYAVKVTPNAGYRLEDGVAGAYTLTVAGFAGDCLKQVSIDTDPTASSCTNLTDGTNFTSWISIQLDKGVVYKIDGTVVTSQYTQVTPDVVHHVTAEAAAGFTLAGTHAHEWDLIATDTADSCIATGGTATPAVTHTAATCSAAGSYTLGVEEPELVSDILWTVNGESAVAGTFTAPTGTTLHIVATAVAGSGISGSETGSQEWTITIPASSAPCDLTTLAFTGVGSETSTLLIVALLLMLAGAGVFTASRLRSRAS
ncbi:MAG: hypothetical protein ABI400_01610 [Lacisediminihabitans sp.]